MTLVKSLHTFIPWVVLGMCGIQRHCWFFNNDTVCQWRLSTLTMAPFSSCYVQNQINIYRCYPRKQGVRYAVLKTPPPFTRFQKGDWGEFPPELSKQRSRTSYPSSSWRVLKFFSLRKSHSFTQLSSNAHKNKSWWVTIHNQTSMIQIYNAIPMAQEKRNILNISKKV